ERKGPQDEGARGSDDKGAEEARRRQAPPATHRPTCQRVGREQEIGRRAKEAASAVDTFDGVEGKRRWGLRWLRDRERTPARYPDKPRSELFHHKGDREGHEEYPDVLEQGHQAGIRPQVRADGHDARGGPRYRAQKARRRIDSGPPLEEEPVEHAQRPGERDEE